MKLSLSTRKSHMQGLIKPKADLIETGLLAGECQALIITRGFQGSFFSRLMKFESYFVGSGL